MAGHVVVTNYDPELLPDSERAELQRQADRWPKDEIYVEIKPGYPGGEFPFRGTIAFRSFIGILQFLGAGIAAHPEFAVDLDPRTPPVIPNPTKTLEIREMAGISDEEAVFSVRYRGSTYAIIEREHTWNRETFRLLYQIFQMAVSEVARPVAPAITIAK